MMRNELKNSGMEGNRSHQMECYHDLSLASETTHGRGGPETTRNSTCKITGFCLLCFSRGSLADNERRAGRWHCGRMEMLSKHHSTVSTFEPYLERPVLVGTTSDPGSIYLQVRTWACWAEPVPLVSSGLAQLGTYVCVLLLWLRPLFVLFSTRSFVRLPPSPHG